MKDGIYKLQAKLGELYCNVSGSSLEAGAKIQMWGNENDGSEEFHIRATNDPKYGECFTITSVLSGRMCCISENKLEILTNIIQLDEFSGTQPNIRFERWKIDDQGNGFYSISPVASQELFWNLLADSKEPGTKIILYYSLPNVHDNNLFRFIPV